MAFADTTGHAAGLVLMGAGVIWSNEAVKKMAKEITLPFQVGSHSSTSDRQARAVIRKYREKHGNGRTFMIFIAALALIGLGGIMFISTKF